GPTAAWNAALARAAGGLLLSAGLLAALLVAGRARPRVGPALAATLPVLLLADLVQAHGDYLPTVPASHYFPPTAATSFLATQAGPFRTANGFPPNTNLPYGLAALGGYDALTPRSYSELVSYIDPLIPRNKRRHFNANDMLQSRVWNLLGVSYVIGPAGSDPNELADVRQETSGDTVGEIRGPAQAGQTFVASHDNLAGLDLLGATYGGHSSGRLVFHLKHSPTDPADLVTVALDAAHLPDNSYWPVRFPPVIGTRGQSFYFYLDAPDAGPGQAATLWYNPNDVYPEGSRMAAGAPAAGDLVFRTWSRFAPTGPWLEQVGGGLGEAGVYANRAVLPRAWLVHHVEVGSDPMARVARLYEPTFDWRTSALLGAPLPDGALPAGAVLTTTDTVSITRYAAEAVNLTTQSSAPALLVLSDQDFPGWEAQVDGRPAAILTADHALRGVLVPAGRHAVRFSYRPASVAGGAGLTGVGLVLLALLCRPRLGSSKLRHAT
ncbi:MAG TPA: hypothetical protein VM536_22570, partial [Chloroflexia bacterium]|nr:hypothetical protein [Chloroflexia bacterium]